MSLNAGTIEYTVSVETQQSIDAANKINQSLDKTEKQMIDTDKSTNQLNLSMSKLAKAIGGVVAVTAVYSQFKQAVKVTAQFNETISNLSALTGLAGDDLNKLSDAARRIGATTSLSATQAAKGMALIGSQVPELLASTDALEKVTQAAAVLAEAAKTDLPAAAQAISGAINQFGLAAQDTDMIINTLAAGARAGASSVEQTASALARAGTTADGAGVSFTEFNALVQTLAKGQITAAEAGTGLRNVILKLDTSVDQNLRPSVVGIGAALRNMEKEVANGTSTMDKFGLENKTAADVLLKNIGFYEQTVVAITDTNEAYEQQRKNNDNLATDVKALNSAYENMLITVGQKLDPTLRGFTQTLTEMLQWVDKGEDGVSKFEKILNLTEIAGTSVAAVLAGRVATSLAVSAKGFYANVIAARATAASAVQAAQAAAILAAQNLIAARAAEAAAVGLGHHATAARALAVADTQARAAVDALTAAQARLNGMMTLGARAAGFLRTGLAFLGGPLGVALLAASALYMLSSSAKDVTVDMTNLKAPLDDVVEALQKLDTIARDTELRNMRKGVQELEAAYKAMGDKVANTARRLDQSLTENEISLDGVEQAFRDVQDAGINAANGVPQEFDKLYESIKNNENISESYQAVLLDLVSKLSAAQSESAAAAIQYDNVATAAAGMGQEANAAAGEIDNLNESLRTGSSAAAEYAQKMSRALEDKKDNSAVGRLSRDIRDNTEAWSTATKAELDAAYATAAASDAYDAQQKALKKTTTARKRLTEAQREAKKAEDDAKRGAESNTKAIDDLRESISQTALSAGELAARQAELRLNQYATPEQIALIRELGAELYDINELQRKQDAFGKDVGGKIRGDVPVLQGGGFDDGTARYEAEAEAERQRYAEQLERMVEAEELKLEVAGGYDAMREQLYQEHSDRMAEIDRVRTEMQLTQWAQGFGDMSKGLADFANTFAKENKAMFAISKAAAIAQTVIQTYQGAQSAYAAMASIPIVGPGLGIAAAAAAVMGGMARVANIRSQSMGGGRRYGGAVNDNKYYRVNEDGRPEIFKGDDGSQYMMPNQRGEVVSHDDAIGGQQRAGNTVNVTQNITMRSDNGNYTARQVMLESSQRQAIAEARLG
ncbi:MAG: phage tail tape measure protein [Desulfuromonas sp.]|nr:phage tail tape measure protein [Desulfuromonas sp.]